MAQNTLIYPSHYQLMEELTNEQAGILIKTIGKYQRGEDIVISDTLVKGVWLAMKHDFDVQKIKYKNKVKANQENGKKGGRPKNPKNPMGLLETQPNPKNLKDKDKDKDINKDKYHKLNSYNTKHEGVPFKTILSVNEFNKILNEKQ